MASVEERRRWARARAVVGLAVAALVAIACEARTIDRAELTAYGITYGFAATFDVQGRPLRITPPFVIEGGAVVVGRTPSLELRDDERGWVIVGLDDARLRATVGGFAPARRAELSAIIADPPEAPVPETTESGPVMRIGVPSSAVLLSGDGAGRPQVVDAAALPVLHHLALLVPYDPDYCGIRDQSRFHAFADDERPFRHLREIDVSQTIAQLAWMDDTHLLALTTTELAVLELGRALEDPARMVRLLPDGIFYPLDARAMKMALDPRPRPDGRTHVVIVSGRPEEPGHAWDVLASPTSLEIARTATLAHALTGIAFDPARGWFATTDDALVYVRSSDDGDFVEDSRLALWPEADADPAILAATGDRLTPMFALSRSRAHLYDPGARQWTAEELYQSGLLALEPVDFRAIGAAHRVDGKLELWGGAQRGLVFRKVGEQPWEKIEVQLPPKLRPCGNLDEVLHRVVYDHRMLALALDDTYVHVALEACDAVLQLRRDDACPSAVGARSDGSVQKGEGFFAVAARPGRLVIGGVAGLVLTSTWTPSR